ncbi:MAG: YlxR family protein [Clostridia bacterium]
MPSRKCIGCNQMKEKNLLLRIVKNKDGDIFFDSTGKANGRGAYLCKSRECFAKCRKGGRLEKTFSSKIDENVFQSLQNKLDIELSKGSADE